MGSRPRRSLKELSAEVATNPDSAAFVELVAAYRERGDLDRALRLCLRGLARHPTHVEAHYECGRVYEARGEPELALDEWAIVSRLAPDHVEARIATADLLVREGRAHAATREIEAARRLAPHHPRVRELSRQVAAPGPEDAENPAVSSVESGSRSEPPPTGVPGHERIPGDDRARDGDRRNRSEAQGVARARAEPAGPRAVLSLNGNGQVQEGDLPLVQGGGREELIDALTGIRADAERMTGYLELGAWVGLVVEGRAVRLSVAPLDAGIIAMVTESSVPAGRAARWLARERDGTTPEGVE